MSKKVKEMMISEIRERLDGSRDLLVVDVSKLDANTANRWRLELRAKEIRALTVKNTLARNVLAENGVEGAEELFSGPTTLVWGGEDIVALSKEIAKWAKDVEALQIKGAAVEGKTLDEEGVVQLSKSPGRAELLGQIVTLILSPGARLAGALLGPGGTVSGQLKALADKEESA